MSFKRYGAESRAHPFWLFSQICSGKYFHSVFDVDTWLNNNVWVDGYVLSKMNPLTNDSELCNLYALTDGICQHDGMWTYHFCSPHPLFALPRYGINVVSFS